MSIASRIAGWIVKVGANSLVETANAGADIVDRFVETTSESRIANLAETESMRDFLLQQARNKSTLGAGWVGALGWVCTAAFAINFVGTPLMAWWYAGQGKPFTAPVFDVKIIVGMIVVLLGLPLLEVMKAWFSTTTAASETLAKKPEPKEQKEPITAVGSTALTG